MKNATAVKERPILFSGPMIRAILRDRKTQTRRAVNPQPWLEPDGALGWRSKGDYIEWNNGRGDLSPYGVPGDRFWVRETWCPLDAPDHFADPSKPKDFMIYGRRNGAAYRAECNDAEGERCRKELGYRWRPSIFMPRWASRITLEITEVRVQRVQETSEEDARAEGVDITTGRIDAIANCETEPKNLREVYGRLWDFLNAKSGYSWASDPWVWVIGFKRVTI